MYLLYYILFINLPKVSCTEKELQKRRILELLLLIVRNSPIHRRALLFTDFKMNFLAKEIFFVRQKQLGAKARLELVQAVAACFGSPHLANGSCFFLLDYFSTVFGFFSLYAQTQIIKDTANQDTFLCFSEIPSLVPSFVDLIFLNVLSTFPRSSGDVNGISCYVIDNYHSGFDGLICHGNKFEQLLLIIGVEVHHFEASFEGQAFIAPFKPKVMVCALGRGRLNVEFL